MSDPFQLIRNNDLEGLKRLLQQNPQEKHARNSVANTLLTFSLDPQIGPFPHIATWLIDIGVDLNAANNIGGTALMLACQTDQPGVAELLMQRGAKLDLQANDGATALMFACRYDQPGVAELLIQRGAKLDLQQKDGWTALMIACRHDQPGVAELLIQRGAKLDLQDKDGWTALMFACRHDQPGVAELLIQRGAKLDLQQPDGWTALMVACYSEKDTQLLSFKHCYIGGADITLKNDDSETVMDIARKEGKSYAVSLLEFSSSELGSILVEEFKLPRSCVVSFFDNEVLSVEDCAILTENDLESLGVSSLMKRRKLLKRLQNGKRLSLAKRISKRISKRLSGVMKGRESFHYDAFLTHDWGEDGENHKRVSEVNSRIRASGKVTWFDEEKLSGNIVLQITQGIESSRKIVVFITERYMKKLNSVNEDYCREEFLAACRVRGVKNMIACVMEPSMLNASSWTGPLQLKMGGELYIDFSSKELRETNFPLLLSRLAD